MYQCLVQNKSLVWVNARVDIEKDLDFSLSIVPIKEYDSPTKSSCHNTSHLLMEII